MYSTKLVNKNFVDGNAYITVGDPYSDPKANPFRQPKKGEKAPNPFRTVTIPKNAENGNFSKLTYVSGGFFENIKYKDTQPLDNRKKGFGSRDASKTDEFANSIRTEQYRETLRKEKELLAQNSEKIKEDLTRLLAQRAMSITKDTLALSQSSGFSYSQKVPQYDIGRTRVTEFDPKSTKDHFYKFDDERPKRFGETGNQPVSYQVGAAAWEVGYKPPAHGGKSETRNFYDKSHLNVAI
eukprot:gene8343-11287_t